MDIVQQDFVDRLAGHGITLSARQLEQFETYYRELVDWNERMNLTGITERDQVYIKHFYDSVSLSFYVPLQEFGTLADIGSGAGFPSVPLKIVFPHLKLTIVDSLNKRIHFLTHICSSLGLEGVECVHGRAEELGHNAKYREQFDLVTARAVARMNVLNEFCLPFVRKAGLFVAMKGTDPTEELKEADRSMKELKAKLENVHQFQLPIEEAHRHLIVLRKTDHTPKKYPRKPGTPLRSPLV